VISVSRPEEGMVVYAAGVFDPLHWGHIKYLETAKSLGDILIVGVVDDDGVSRYKPKRPMLCWEERKSVVEALRCVDYVVKQDDTDPTATLKRLVNDYRWQIDIMVRGEDYQGSPPGTHFMNEQGGKVVRLPYSWEISSSEIKRRMKQ